KTAGQRLALVAVEIGDDEQPVVPAEPEQKPKGGELAKVAGMLSANPEFQFWCGTFSAEQAAGWIRATCGVSSRAELDHNHDAAQKFHRLVRIPFVERDQ